MYKFEIWDCLVVGKTVQVWCARQLRQGRNMGREDLQHLQCLPKCKMMKRFAKWSEETWRGKIFCTVCSLQRLPGQCLLCKDIKSEEWCCYIQQLCYLVTQTINTLPCWSLMNDDGMKDAMVMMRMAWAMAMEIGKGSGARIAWRSSPRSWDPLTDKRILSETRGWDRQDLGDANIPTRSQNHHQRRGQHPEELSLSCSSQTFVRSLWSQPMGQNRRGRYHPQSTR